MLGSAAPGHLADSAPFLLLLGTVGPLPLGWSYCVYESWTPRLPGTEGGRDPRFCSLPLSLDVGGGEQIISGHFLISPEVVGNTSGLYPRGIPAGSW